MKSASQSAILLLSKTDNTNIFHSRGNKKENSKMENNVIIAKGFKFTNKELEKATKTIIKAEEKTCKSLIEIALTIQDVARRRLFADDFKSITEYGEKVFGYKKSSIYNMLNVSQKFLMDNGHSVLTPDDDKTQDFTFNQLVHMLPLSAPEVIELVDDSKITVDMTLKEIDKVIKDYTKTESENEVIEPESVEDVSTTTEEINEVELAFQTILSNLFTLKESLTDEKYNKSLDAIGKNLSKLMNLYNESEDNGEV